MENRKAKNIALKHILCCLILLLAFVITITRVNAQTESDLVVSETKDTVPLKTLIKVKSLKLKDINDNVSFYTKYDTPRVVEKNINYYIEVEEETLKFFSKAVGYDIEFIKEDLLNKSNIDNYEPTNIGSLKDKNVNIMKFDSIEYGIVEYFYDLLNNKPGKRKKIINQYSGSSDYVEKLIMYYTKIYTNVDSSLALSIGAAESGYYKVKYMLNKNNIYGGMSSNGLIQHENIELGTLRYVRMLSKNYIEKGLTTLESIGRVYCPTTNEYGQKVASSHWINLVNTAKNKYSKYTQNIEIKDLVNY